MFNVAYGDAFASQTARATHDSYASNVAKIVTANG